LNELILRVLLVYPMEYVFDFPLLIKRKSECIYRMVDKIH
jgi:hypothetical protein